METEHEYVDLDKVRVALGVVREAIRMLGLSCVEQNVVWHMGQQADDQHFAMQHSAEDSALCRSSREPLERELCEAIVLAHQIKAVEGLGKPADA